MPLIKSIQLLAAEKMQQFLIQWHGQEEEEDGEMEDSNTWASGGDRDFADGVDAAEP